MATVFLSYDHEDSERAAPIAAAIEANGHSVWWDRHIHGGAEYNSEIENAVERSDAVVVLWSDKSVRSPWVRDEAGEGRDRGRLVPVLIETVKPPMGFRQYQTIDLAGWNGGKKIPRLPELLHAIETVSAGAAELPPPVESAPSPAAAQAPRVTQPRQSGVSRRALVGSGTAAAVAALAGGGLWWSARNRTDPRVQALLDKANDSILHGTIDQPTMSTVQQAVSFDPDNAKALGLLALVSGWNAGLVDPGAGAGRDTAALVQQAESAAKRALSVDPEEPNALLAMFELQGTTLNWAARDQRLRQIIAIDPHNFIALTELVLLTQATGYCRESWSWNERAIALAPLSGDALGRRALKLWILGNPSEADKVIDQLRSLYPGDAWVAFVRFQLYVFTGRFRAAQDMVDRGAAPGGPNAAGIWRTCLAALDHPSPGSISKAREACIKGALSSPQFASEAVLIMATLGDLDTAFDLANGFLLSRGPFVPPETGHEASWRISTQWMFSPPTAPMYADARFLQLCEGIGLTDCWKKRGIKPDYQRA
jgi:tetratricopeptide (TPR) repeat protein